MSTEKKYPHDAAARAASYIAKLLMPHCTRLDIAGSIRRIRHMAKDIEIVCEPKKEFEQTGLFADVGEWLVSKDFSEGLALITDEVVLGNVSGRYMKILTNSRLCPGIKLDLFMPQPDDYYRILAIRTGSRDYAERYIASSWKRKGWVGTHDGLRKIDQCTETPSGWKCTAGKPTLPPVWKSEGEFFTWLGTEYKDPADREIHKSVNESL